MLNRPIEYEKMSEVEDELWWYQNLRQLVLQEIQNQLGDLGPLHILDAGCGTGGLFTALKKSGSVHMSGFDLSEHAVRLCATKGFNIQCLDLRSAHLHYPPQSFDAIICNDVLYFLSEEERTAFFSNMRSLLKSGGILIANVPAFAAFSGTHDLSVGIKKRFTRRSFFLSINREDFEVKSTIFWPFFISPLIYLARLVQRIKLKLGKVNLQSDVNLPSPLINQILFAITSFENRVLSRKPFGSSLLVTLRRKERT